MTKKPILDFPTWPVRVEPNLLETATTLSRQTHREQDCHIRATCLTGKLTQSSWTIPNHQWSKTLRAVPCLSSSRAPRQPATPLTARVSSRCALSRKTQLKPTWACSRTSRSLRLPEMSQAMRRSTKALRVPPMIRLQNQWVKRAKDDPERCRNRSKCKSMEIQAIITATDRFSPESSPSPKLQNEKRWQ